VNTQHIGKGVTTARISYKEIVGSTKDNSRERERERERDRKLHNRMSSLSEKFLPLATGEDPETGIPTYYPNGPGSSNTAAPSYNNSVVSSSTTGLNISSSGSGQGPYGDNGTNANTSSSHLFCNCCCDCRRACLVLNSISIALKILMIVSDNENKKKPLTNCIDLT
jgi:hypothetical protein